ncbi:MAG: DegQ family serine endoprotease [Proteobacteria bacterium]|nr:DegQ family serine endoprotease [Pseudomonadota bacterium]MBI3499085.1 DegQ family serine endoprotease [Pseudomonadota bacterium]
MTFESSREPPSTHVANHRRKFFNVLAAALMATTALTGTAMLVRTGEAAAPVNSPAQAPITVPATGMQSFAPIVERVAPAVVNVATTQLADRDQAEEDSGNPFQNVPPDSPMGEMLKRFFGGQGRGPMTRSMPQRHQQKVHALGSGFIIDPMGYIATNNHVVGKASDITVTLNDGQQLKAKLIGRDPKTDLALLKVDAGKSLPYVGFGDSQTAKPGDWVVAVGNPFGLGGSVTAGIVSARGRDIGSGPYDDFLQIDAPINRGNSGGPSFNLAGEVVGINTAIYSPSGGSVGIGFAIPASLAKPVLDQLREHGRVDRGWIGVKIQPVTPDMAEGLGLKAAKGALVAGVDADGPAARAGVRQGDVIVGFNGSAIDDLHGLPRTVAATPAGKSVDVVVSRDGAEQTLRLEVGGLKDDQMASADQPSAAADNTLGMRLAPLNQQNRQRFDIAREVKGVIVADVRPDGPAAEVGINAGDIISRVGSASVNSPEQVVSTIKEAQRAGRKAVTLLVNRGGEEHYVAVPLKA